MAHRIVFTGKQQVHLEAFEPKEVGPDEIAVRSLYSLMSTGTENIVFNRLFEPGTHWDRWVKYPFYPGYALVGEVVNAGNRVQKARVGDRVALRSGHASFQVVSADAATVVPAGVGSREAAWFALGKIASMSARAAQYQVGDTVVVIGAGPVGQMALRWANACSAETLVVVDRFASRLEMARRGGASHVLAKPIEECLEDIQAANSGELPRVVIDATGHPQVFVQALRMARPRGRVVLLGDTGTPSNQHLSSDVIAKGLTIAGAHDSHVDADWSAARIHRLFFRLVETARFPLTGLNTHEFRPEECERAYALANSRREDTMGILFNWC